MNKDIIRIAEAMNVVCQECDNGLVYQYDDAGRKWKFSCDRCKGAGIPNPLTSHADCHALIEWLQAQGWIVMRLQHPERRTIVSLQHVERGPEHKLTTEVDDYRIGVVELTLKILDESDE